MGSIWVDSLGRTFQAALDFIEAAVRDCTDELWIANLWTVPVDSAVDVRRSDGTLVTDLAERGALVQRQGTPWAVTWHALEVLDAKLTAGVGPWEPWARFDGRTGDDITTLSNPWTQADLLEYIEYCRRRVVDTLDQVTDEKASTIIGRRSEPYAAYLMRLPGHVIEHGSQIREFLSAAGVLSSMPYFGFAPK